MDEIRLEATAVVDSPLPNIVFSQCTDAPTLHVIYTHTHTLCSVSSPKKCFAIIVESTFSIIVRFTIYFVSLAFSVSLSTNRSSSECAWRGSAMSTNEIRQVEIDLNFSERKKAIGHVTEWMNEFGMDSIDSNHRFCRVMRVCVAWVDILRKRLIEDDHEFNKLNKCGAYTSHRRSSTNWKKKMFLPSPKNYQQPKRINAKRRWRKKIQSYLGRLQ